MRYKGTRSLYEYQREAGIQIQSGEESVAIPIAKKAYTKIPNLRCLRRVAAEEEEDSVNGLTLCGQLGFSLYILNPGSKLLGSLLKI